MDKPQIAVIGGTGLGEVLAEQFQNVVRERPDTPFGAPSAPIIIGTLGANRIAFLNRHGEGHSFNPSQIPYAANIFALKTLGVTAVIASGAVGSLRQEIAPRDLVLVDQFIDKTWRRQNTFFDKLGAVHTEFAAPCCERLREKLLVAGQTMDAKVHAAGTYICMEGPQFSSRAESLMHRQWGGDLIGMTALPEARLAREAQMCYVLAALVSDYDCWREPGPAQDKQTLLEEIIGNLAAAADNAITLIKRLLETDGRLADDRCPCRHSLQYAVWTKPEAVDSQHQKELAVLFE